jgi:hypothetical protein
LYGSTSPSSTSPYWAGVFEALQGNSGLPSYEPQENDKEINKITPENVSDKVFEMLNIKARLNMRSISFGKLYNNSLISFIPDFEPDYNKLSSCKLFVRMDIHHNEEIVFNLLKSRNSPVSIITHTPLSGNFLKAARSKVQRIIQTFKEGYKLEDLENLKNSGIPYSLVWIGKKDNLSDVRLELFDFEAVGSRVVERDDRIKKDTLFTTKQFFLGRGKHYVSAWHYKHGVEELSSEVGREVGDALESDEFWESKDAFYFFEKINK